MSYQEAFADRRKTYTSLNELLHLLRKDGLSVVTEKKKGRIHEQSRKFHLIRHYNNRKKATCNALKFKKEKKPNHSQVTETMFLISMGTTRGKKLRYYFML